MKSSPPLSRNSTHPSLVPLIRESWRRKLLSILAILAIAIVSICAFPSGRSAAQVIMAGGGRGCEIDLAFCVTSAEREQQHSI
jgi:hypothetical protein